jgi:hypothetical protein
MAEHDLPDADELARQVRKAIRELADWGYLDDSSATLALLALDIGHRRVISQDSHVSVWGAVDGRHQD